MYNHYLDCRDTNYYVCEDSILDVLALPGEKVKHLTPVLACQDRSLRVLRDSTLMYNVELPGMNLFMKYVYVSVSIISYCVLGSEFAFNHKILLKSQIYLVFAFCC